MEGTSAPAGAPGPGTTRRNPDVLGAAGNAWRLKTEGHPTTLAQWIAHVPSAHPFWPWCLVTLIHLREVEGFPPAVKTKPGATHEIMIFAIDPERCPEPDPERCPEPDPDRDPELGFPYLTPANLVDQFLVKSDEDALKLVKGLVKGFCAGLRTPDSDGWTQNCEVIGNTAEHMRLGGHPDR